MRILVDRDVRCTKRLGARRGERQALDCVIRLSITGGANGVMTGSERCQALRAAPIVKDRPAFRRPFNSFVRNCVPPESETIFVRRRARFPYHVGAAAHHRNCTHGVIVTAIYFATVGSLLAHYARIGRNGQR